MNIETVCSIAKRIRQLFVNLPIRFKFVILIVPIVILPLLSVSIAIHVILGNYLTKQSIAHLHTDIEKIDIQFQKFIEKTEKMSINIITSGAIQALGDYPNTDWNQNHSIVSVMRNMKNDDIDSIFFIDSRDKIYTLPYENHHDISIDEVALNKQLAGTSGKMVWWYDKDILTNQKDKSFVYAARVVNHLDYNRKLGILIFRIKLEDINEVFSDVIKERKKYYFLADKSNHPILTSETPRFIHKIFDSDHSHMLTIDQRGVYSQDVGGVESLVLVEVINGLEWKISGIIPDEYVSAPARQIQRFIILVSLFSMLVATVLALIFAFSFTNPIEKLIIHIRKIKNKGFNLEIDLKRKDEIGELADNYNQMSREIKTLIENIKIEQENAREAELRMLIEQINPHFLYNTLDNINMLALRSGDERISLLITSLSKLLRHSLNKGDSLVSLYDELDYARRYLLIQKMRHGQLFNFQVDFPDESLRNIKVMKLILQPLIENSIIHGFKDFNEGGIIRVHAYLEKEELVLEVEDNGRGVSEKYLELMNVGKFEKNTSTGGGYGLNNVNLRIKKKYGDAYNLKFRNLKPQGFLCRIRIPLKFLNEI
ncbi:cache domain-containing sensor histidine kinase [Bacillus sp. Marseille-P3661]|uniref:cache domain-containing sensor histidine kinase n=1 Tax=Bacillus sp. Marseille-P3661 TaxID=1936234 RepID=UPI000C83B570|nr:sensor histidine kinase [Bacillus sp. Marseille-P3661]